MTIDKDESERIGKLIVPFALAIFLALLIEDLWLQWSSTEKLTIILVLVIALTIVYRKQVRSLLD
jgi:hypothetical protein